MSAGKAFFVFVVPLFLVFAGCNGMFTPGDIENGVNSGNVDAAGISVYPKMFVAEPGQSSDALEAEIVPEDASDRLIIWESDDSTVATVDPAGVVTAVSDGTAWITATTADGEYSDHVFVLSGDVVESRGPAGGKIFYHDADGEHEWDYLELAPEESEFVGRPWGGKLHLLAGDTREKGIGDGRAATDHILFFLQDEDPYYDGYDEPDWAPDEYAARLADTLVVENMGREFRDWFLPSESELQQATLLHFQGLAGLSETEYWTSSELATDDGDRYAKGVDFAPGSGSTYSPGGQIEPMAKDELARIRAIRSFSPDIGQSAD